MYRKVLDGPVPAASCILSSSKTCLNQFESYWIHLDPDFAKSFSNKLSTILLFLADGTGDLELSFAKSGTGSDGHRDRRNRNRFPAQSGKRTTFLEILPIVIL
eukprot:s1053_g21.t1